MKKRAISGTILVVVVILFFICDNPFLDTLVVFTLSCVGIYEYNKDDA